MRQITCAIVVTLMLAGCGVHSPTYPQNETQDAAFIAELTTRGVEITDRNNLINAGHDICARLQRGEGSIEASTHVMDTYGLKPGQQGITAVAGAATDVYCADPGSVAMPTTPPPTSSSPTAQAIEPGPHSQLADITLPAGTVPDGTLEDRELWKVITPYDDTVQYLRQQLPIGHDYQGLQWCGQDIKDLWTEWNWADTKEFLQVHLSRDGHLGILRLAEGGCAGP
jgi:hypothetical protein